MVEMMQVSRTIGFESAPLDVGASTVDGFMDRDSTGNSSKHLPG